MKKVITYGTYDLLHYGHIRLLERAKALGDYLIVGVTSDDYDKSRGKINVQQSLSERMAAIRAAGLADEIIVEEYEGQKIDDIRRYGADVFAIGSDWEGKFDYLKEYCEVVYLSRTEGVSSTDIRSASGTIRLGLVGNSTNVDKVSREAGFVDGLETVGICDGTDEDAYRALLDKSDAVYIYSRPELHASEIRQAILAGKHVLCETPLTMKTEEADALFRLAEEHRVVLMEALKTAFSTAYERLIVMLKSGKIGEIVSVDAACTSMAADMPSAAGSGWGSLSDWGPTALLPVFQLLGTAYTEKHMVTKPFGRESKRDAFTKIDFVYDSAVASIRVGKGVKSEGELVISGTKGYAYVPAPWWKTESFEIRFEDPRENKRYFYQMEGEGIRYELVAFLHNCIGRREASGISREVTAAIVRVMEDYENGRELTVLKERG